MATCSADPRHAPTVLPAARAVEAELRAGGLAACSAYLTAPTFGGGSWLSHATLASGVRIDSQIAHDLLLASRLVPLADYFNRAGYRTALVMPGTLWPWPEGGVYLYDQAFIAPDFGYRGPAFGFAPMPDQFVLDWWPAGSCPTALLRSSWKPSSPAATRPSTSRPPPSRIGTASATVPCFTCWRR